ncbi:MAG: U32 family peptidase [Armatimonadetes bacterium]|nr:U32 family peptidase [Armatimonadota bacterium]
MRFSVATNFDDVLPGLVAPYRAVELFGKLSRDFVGGGRASYMLASTSRRRLREHVQRAHECGLEFNYLINSACLDNREFTRSGQRAIRRLLDWLSEINVDSVTVSIPYLLELVKDRYPHFKVRIGVFAAVDTPKKAKFYEDLGVDCITLQPLMVNRDFARLRAIRAAVRCDLQLIVNSNCLLECPMTPYHNVGLSHASQHGSRGLLIDYCLLRCTIAKLADPVNYIKAPWIRPEDLHHYESIGYSSFKILERDAPTATLEKRVRAYHDRGFDGNLAELVLCYGYRDAHSAGQPRRNRLWEMREFFKPWKINPLRLLPLKSLAKLQGMIYSYSGSDSLFHIDNRALDGFIEKFLQECCVNLECADCRYCHDYAERAVTLDAGYRDRCLDLASRLVDDLRTGGMWERSCQ